MTQIEEIYKELRDCKYLLIWNKLERWGDENDRLFRADSVTSKEGKLMYSGDVMEYIKINSRGIGQIPIPFIKIYEIPQEQIKSLESYLSLVGREGEELNKD
jgi:hypothetical protein